jgi:hypothetical protein
MGGEGAVKLLVYSPKAHFQGIKEYNQSQLTAKQGRWVAYIPGRGDSVRGTMGEMTAQSKGNGAGLAVFCLRFSSPKVLSETLAATQSPVRSAGGTGAGTRHWPRW